MIIWLASYPRCGNTLLRTILKQTMGLGSYSDEPIIPNIGMTDKTNEILWRSMIVGVRETVGLLPKKEPWETFYEKSMAEGKTYFVKSHLPPRDDQPAIYITRDGRSALESYYNYHNNFLAEKALSLISLVLGADFYGDWSEHYENWVSDRRKTLVLRFEDLIDPSPEALQSIAQFIGHDGPISDWSNPFDYLQKHNPKTFRVGKAEWTGAPEWSELINGVFFLLHGDLMVELGYADKESVEEARDFLNPGINELVEASRTALKQKASFENISGERLEVIKVLDAEVKKLTARKGF